MSDLRERLQSALAPRYTIEKEIGRGGMAAVFLASDVKHGRRVALKVLHPALAAALGTERFLREIATTASLQHPHILTVHDSGDADGLVYYTMPFVDGESLRERLAREGELGTLAAVRILREVLEALAYAHQLGIVHRDIKPENIMLSGRHAWLMDFGIAKAMSDTLTIEGLTAPGGAIGTPAYMAPEQAAAGGEVDHRADIYAIGVVAYELLAGRTPFRGTPQQILTAHATHPASPLLSQRPGMARALADAVMRCLEKRPADRWQNAGELLLRLDAMETDREPDRIASPRQLTDRTFTLTEAVCRRLDRASLDPRMIGDVMTYLDNNADSDVLVCYLHGLGLDQRDFAGILSDSPYRSIAPTLYGCEPHARRRASLPLAAHVTLVQELVRDVVERLRPAATIVVGFSSGADFALEMLSAAGRAMPLANGVMTLDCNLALETCFLTRSLAEMTLDDPAKLLAQLRAVGERLGSVREWIDVHDYLVKILRKFPGDIGPLGRFAADVVRPFTIPGQSRFVDWFTAVAPAVTVVRCVFSDSDANTTALNEIKLANLDRSVLGPSYQPDCLVTEPGTEHFDLMNPAVIGRNLDAIVARLRLP